MKTKLFLRSFVGTFGTLRFYEKSCFFNKFLGFTPHWDYKPTNAINADDPSVYTSEKVLSLSTINETRLKCDVFDGSVVIGVRQRKLYNSV